MRDIFAIAVAVIALAVFFWMVRGKTPEVGDDLAIDPSDSRTIGTLIGMTGGSITDAAVARYALQRFQEIHGRKATTRDMGLVAGLMTEKR